MDDEHGRSLTELLGILSIMGILSLVGLKMYHSAVNSHRANELIYEANKRATMVAAQVMAGRSADQLSLSEFTDPAGYHFGVEANPANDKQFNITLTGVSEEVCQKMKLLVGEGTAIRLISKYCDKLTYNGDLSTTGYASDIQTKTACEAGLKTWCGGRSLCQDGTDCCAGLNYDTQCQVCNEGAIMSSPQEGKTCTYRDGETQKTGICHLGTCEPAATGMTCNPNQIDCTCTVMNGNTPVLVEGEPLQGHVCSMDRATNTVKLCCRMEELCNSAGDVSTTNQAKCVTLSGETNTKCSTNADCSGSTPWCKITASTDVRTPKTGTCTSITTTTNGGIKASETSVYGLGNVIVSSGTMNWWSAKNWCEAHGKKLIHVEAFQVYYPTGTNAGKLVKTASNSGGPVPACRQGKVCTHWSGYPVSTMWAGTTEPTQRTLTGARNANGELYSNLYSPVVLDLAQQFKGVKNSFWTASDYSSSDSSCAFYVPVTYGHVSNFFRTNGSFALCQ